MQIPKRLIRVLAVDTAVALIPPLLNLTFHPGIGFRRLLIIYGYSVVYANVIGGLAQLIIPRMWPLFWCYPKPIRWIMLILLLLGVAISGCLACIVIFVAIGWMPAADFWAEFSGSVRISIIITLSIGLLLSIFESLRAQLDATTLALRTKEFERERALKLATEAQLASLESRVHPHFLFNALNSISSLIPEDPKKAERLVERMAALLRFSLDSRNAGLVPLEHEMKIVTDYLEIEKARFGDRLRYEIDIPDELSQAQVPALSVQTLVENSVKHAIGPSRSGGAVRIHGSRSDGCMKIEVSDTGPGFELESAQAGHGIDNLQSRLMALFGAGATVSLAKGDNGSAVILSIPQSHNGNESLPRR